jgi:hypothetical protein
MSMNKFVKDIFSMVEHNVNDVIASETPIIKNNELVEDIPFETLAIKDIKLVEDNDNNKDVELVKDNVNNETYNGWEIEPENAWEAPYRDPIKFCYNKRSVYEMFPELQQVSGPSINIPSGPKLKKHR